MTPKAFKWQQNHPESLSRAETVASPQASKFEFEQTQREQSYYSLEAENKKLVYQNTLLQDELQQVKDQLEYHLRGDCQGKSRTMQEEVRQKTNRIIHLQSLLEDVTRQRDDLAQQVDLFESQRNQLDIWNTQEYHSLKQRYDDLLQSKIELEDKYQQLSQERAGVQENYNEARMSRQLNDLRYQKDQEIFAKDKQIENLKQDLAYYKDSYENLQSRSQPEKQEISQKLDQLEKRLQEQDDYYRQKLQENDQLRWELDKKMMMDKQRWEQKSQSDMSELERQNWEQTKFAQDLMNENKLLQERLLKYKEESSQREQIVDRPKSRKYQAFGGLDEEDRPQGLGRQQANQQKIQIDSLSGGFLDDQDFGRNSLGFQSNINDDEQPLFEDQQWKDFNESDNPTEQFFNNPNASQDQKSPYQIEDLQCPLKTKKPLNVEEYKDKKKVPLKSNIRIKEMPLKNSSYQDDQNDSNDEIGESEQGRFPFNQKRIRQQNDRNNEDIQAQRPWTSKQSKRNYIKDQDFSSPETTQRNKRGRQDNRNISTERPYSIQNEPKIKVNVSAKRKSSKEPKRLKEQKRKSSKGKSVSPGKKSNLLHSQSDKKLTRDFSKGIFKAMEVPKSFCHTCYYKHGHPWAKDSLYN